MKPTNKYFDNYARQAIIEALLRLMKMKEFDKISVSDITQEAAVARRTFYIYYRSKLDVLNDYYAVLCREYDDNDIKDAEWNSLEQIEYFFQFWGKHKDYLRLLFNQDIFYILIAQFSGYIRRRAEYEHKEGFGRYDAAHSAGGLWAVLYVWVDEDFKKSPEVLAQIVANMRG